MISQHNMAIAMMLVVASASIQINLSNTIGLETNKDPRNLNGKHVNDAPWSTMKERQGNICIRVLKV